MRHESRAEQRSIERADMQADLSHLRDKKYDTNVLLGPEPRDHEQGKPSNGLDLPHPETHETRRWSDSDTAFVKAELEKDRPDWKRLHEMAESVNFHEETKGCHVYWSSDRGRPDKNPDKPELGKVPDTNKPDAQRFATRLEEEGLGRYYTLEMTKQGQAFDQSFENNKALWKDHGAEASKLWNTLSERFSSQGDARIVYVCAYGSEPKREDGTPTLLYSKEAENIRKNIDDGKVSLVGVAEYSNENARFENVRYYGRLGE